MTQAKLITVIGATGAQGGGLVRAIAADKSGAYRCRAVTRKTDSDKAKALAKLGVEVVAADLDDEKSLAHAFAGSHGAFCVTNYWEHFSPEKEAVQAGNLARACKSAGVKHVIWSTLEDSRKWVPLTDTRMPTLMGKYKVPHFDAKGESDALFTAAGVPTTFLLTSFYWDNFIHFGMGPKRGPDGKLAITLPMGKAKLPGIAVGDIGACAFGILARGTGLCGKTVGIAGEHLTGAQMAAAFTKALGQPVVYNEVTPEVYRGFAFPGADDLGNMFQLKRDFNDRFCSARDIAFSRSVNPSLQTFETWLSRNKASIPIG
ncbi:MAG: NmrA/HSCARG family protein [Planctomycetes bacterium]|nr:NmrA/HSCARG family protein [Planctomycetota bacterium]